MDLVSYSIGFSMVGDPFSPVTMVISDCPITYISYTQYRRRRDVRQRNVPHRSTEDVRRTKRAVITYDVSYCDSLFSSSSLAT